MNAGGHQQHDQVTNSPVSGMFIRAECDMPQPEHTNLGPDGELLDDSAKFVEISDESKAAIARIPNVIGDYICRLCKVGHDCKLCKKSYLIHNSFYRLNL